MELFIVTAFGIGIDTECHPFKTHEEAEECVKNLLGDFQAIDTDEICTDCLKFFSRKAQCDIEVQIHAKML